MEGNIKEIFKNDQNIDKEFYYFRMIGNIKKNRNMINKHGNVDFIFTKGTKSTGY